MKPSRKIRWLIHAILLLATGQTASANDELPPSIRHQLPPGYEILATARGPLDADALDDYLVALGRSGEENAARNGRDAPRRPLLLFTQNRDGSFRLARRNDHVVMRADQGGQCDPFLDGEERLVIRHRYFTVQNAVACGQHWFWYITFRHDAKQRDWYFHKAVFESWVLNANGEPDTGVLVPGYGKIFTARENPALPFAGYREAGLH